MRTTHAVQAAINHLGHAKWLEEYSFNQLMTGLILLGITVYCFLANAVVPSLQQELDRQQAALEKAAYTAKWERISQELRGY